MKKTFICEKRDLIFHFFFSVMSHKRISFACFLCFVYLIGLTQCWSLSQTWEGNDFFNNFWFWDENTNGPDPTHGYMYYANQQEAFDWGLVSINGNGSVKIGCDCWSVSTGSGRGSVRITSYGTWDYGLFIADLDHMPEGCGTVSFNSLCLILTNF